MRSAPSRITLTWLVASTVIASLVCFSLLSADVDCGSQHWSCRTFGGIGIVAVAMGIACGLLFTSFVVLLGRLVQIVIPRAPALEPSKSGLKVAVTLAAIHFIVFAFMSLSGLLPIDSPGWLGIAGLFTSEPQGTNVYMFVPSK